jgi:thioredoxin reductase
MSRTDVYDCIIVGGGPAGMNAAVVLGRSRRKVLLFDTNQHRNRYSHGMHNYLTRDHVPPAEFVALCQPELDKYCVQRIPRRVIKAEKTEDELFLVRDEQKTTYYAKKMLIATGLTDKLPETEGFQEFYGRSVFHCPYCDGWEVRDKRIGVYARNKEGWQLALSLKTWSKDVTLYTDGKNKVRPYQRPFLERQGIEIVGLPIAKLEGNEGQIERIRFTDGSFRDCDALFFVNGFTQQCNLAETFGCEVSKKGVIVTNRFQQTNISGLYVAGDAARDMHFVVVAAAEGAKAGVTINKELQKEEWGITTELDG